MHVLMELDLTLYLILFLIAGSSGLLVRLDQWVAGDFFHPKTDSGKLDINKSFWSYILTFIMSGLAGMMVSIGLGYFIEQRDTNIMLFSAIMIGAVGRTIFYRLVDWVQTRLEDALNSEKNFSQKNQNNNKKGK